MIKLTELTDCGMDWSIAYDQLTGRYFEDSLADQETDWVLIERTNQGVPSMVGNLAALVNGGYLTQDHAWQIVCQVCRS